MTSINRINQIKFLINPSGKGYLLEVHDIETPSVIADIFGFNSWVHVKTIFNCVTRSHGYAYNDSGITFPEEAAEFGEKQDGIKVYNPIDELEFDKDSFYLLANRYLNIVATLAKKNNDKILNTEWGKEFLEYVSMLPADMTV